MTDCSLGVMGHELSARCAVLGKSAKGGMACQLSLLLRLAYCFFFLHMTPHSTAVTPHMIINA